MKDLKQKAIRGGLAKVCAQGAGFVLRLGSLMILARLLQPKDFGLVGMVTAVVGVLNLFRDFGLSTATVQRTSISQEQVSALFWINVLVGTLLAAVSVGMAPLIAHFYHEPALVSITIVLAFAFVANAAGVQHSAILQREMRFTALSVIDISSLLFSTIVALGLAWAGFRYWALVAMSVLTPAATTVGLWIATRWTPSLVFKTREVSSMMRFGGAITLNSIIVYIAYNLEKVLLGRFWGAEAIGIYGRGYQLINLPTENLNSAIGGVAFSALSRLQDQPDRLRSYFLKGYSMLVTLTIPVTLMCALFANELILVVLGPKWAEVAPIFRLLAPTIMIFAMINPLAWLLFSLGMVGRSLKVAMVLAPLVIGGYLIGLPHGPKGVAFGYSAVMMLWVIPHIAWGVHGTVISLRDILVTISRPLFSALVAGAVAYATNMYFLQGLPLIAKLGAGLGVLFLTYVTMLLYVMRQKQFYVELVQGLRARPAVKLAAV
jgi:O-antigen/teichoic acid export membrane protein